MINYELQVNAFQGVPFIRNTSRFLKEALRIVF